MYKKSYEFMNLVYQNIAKHIPVRGMPEKIKALTIKAQQLKKEKKRKSFNITVQK